MKCLQVIKWIIYLVVIKVICLELKEFKIAKEVKRSDSLWRFFACGYVYICQCQMVEVQGLYMVFHLPCFPRMQSLLCTDTAEPRFLYFPTTQTTVLASSSFLLIPSFIQSILQNTLSHLLLMLLWLNVCLAPFKLKHLKWWIGQFSLYFRHFSDQNPNI